MVIKYRFKFYENIVCGNDKKLYQLEHFKSKRVFPFKELTYNKERKAYRINSQWVSKKRLYRLMIPTDEKIAVFEEKTVLDKLLSDLNVVLIKNNHKQII